MTSTLPTEQKDRVIIVDIIRGFALIGVLIANFTSYVDQQTPESVLNSISSSLDASLMNINTVFFEWKFMTLFSILFGYGFGLILESLQKKKLIQIPFSSGECFGYSFSVVFILFFGGLMFYIYML